MLITKTRKQGSSIIVTLPASNEMNIQINQEYIVSYEDNGTIILVPKIEDPFKDAEPGAFYEVDEWVDLELEEERKYNGPLYSR